MAISRGLLNSIFGGLAGAGQAAGGIKTFQDQQRRFDADQRRLDAEDTWRRDEPVRQEAMARKQAEINFDFQNREKLAEKARKDAEDSETRKVITEHWANAATGDPTAQAAVVARIPALADRFQTPTKAAIPQADKMRARVAELAGGGMPLPTAARQARLEFGETVANSDSMDAAKAYRVGQREDRLQQNFQSHPAVKQAALIGNAAAQLEASASQHTPQGDLNMLYGIVKLRDPNSAVREGEINLQQAARSLGTRFVATWNKVSKGNVLTEQERNDILALVDDTIDQQTRLVAPVQKSFGAQARGIGADSAYVAPDPFGGIRRQHPTYSPDNPYIKR